MIIENDVDFKKPTKCWILDNFHAKGDVKVRYLCHINEKYRSSPYGDCHHEINHKICIIFQHLRN